MKVQVCTGKACKENFSQHIITRLENDKEFLGLKNLILEEGKCMGHCKQGPCATFDGKLELYTNPANASLIASGKGKKEKKYKKH